MRLLYKCTLFVVFTIALITVDNVYAHDGHNNPFGEKIVSQGEFATLQAGLDRNLTISGWVQMIRLTDGKTEVSVYLEGLEPNTTYPAHIHTLPCETGAGAHYKIDPLEKETSKSNEIWPIIETDAKGIGRTNIRVRHWARSDAQSLVIHDPKDGSKIGCADIFLIENQAVSSGDF